MHVLAMRRRLLLLLMLPLIALLLCALRWLVPAVVLSTKPRLPILPSKGGNLAGHAARQHLQPGLQAGRRGTG